MKYEKIPKKRFAAVIALAFLMRLNGQANAAEFLMTVSNGYH
jgi:hypothetical protein